MSIETLSIPQLGEGLYEVNIIKLLKNVGDEVKRDEPLYQVETDKALVDVEASCAGVLERWYCEEGATLGINAPIADIRVAGTKAAKSLTSGAPIDSYALKTQPSWRGEPLESRWTGREQQAFDSNVASGPTAGTPSVPEEEIESYTLSPRQQALVRRMSRRTEAIPATIHSYIDWNQFKEASAKMEESLALGALTDFEYLALAVSRSVRKHTAFRSRIIGYDVQVYPYLNLGVAVGLRNGELAIAVVREADRLAPADFIATLRQVVKDVRHGGDQVGPVMQLQLTHLGTLGVHSATPVLVPPSVGTLFLGSPIKSDATMSASLSLTFDHRLINGVGAAMYLRHLTKLISGQIAMG